MTRARLRALLLAMAALAGAAAIAFAVTRGGETQNRKPGSDKPTLLLLTSLPLMFGDGFSLDEAGSPVLKALETKYRVVPISVTSKEELEKGRLLLMAHPLAQSAENLVALDQWVREGGRVLLLADPLLEWPSDRPLGDPLRPPPVFMDTGLLAHWGLRLEPPRERGPMLAHIGGSEVMLASPGRLSGVCKLGEQGIVAHCSLGKGMATVIADADLLDVEHLDGPTQNNVSALLNELASLQPK